MIGKILLYFSLLVFFFQVLMGLPYGSVPRKTVPRSEQSTAMDYSVLMDFNVSLIQNENGDRRYFL